VAYIYWGISGYLDAKDIPHVKKLQTASAAYFKQGEKRTAVDVLEHFGEVNPQFKQYVFRATLRTASGAATLTIIIPTFSRDPSSFSGTSFTM
jgi:hypothetical protein